MLFLKNYRAGNVAQWHRNCLEAQSSEFDTQYKKSRNYRMCKQNDFYKWYRHETDIGSLLKIQ